MIIMQICWRQTSCDAIGNAQLRHNTIRRPNRLASVSKFSLSTPSTSINALTPFALSSSPSQHPWPGTHADSATSAAGKESNPWFHAGDCVCITISCSVGTRVSCQFNYAIPSWHCKTIPGISTAAKTPSPKHWRTRVEGMWQPIASRCFYSLINAKFERMLT